MQLTMLGEYRSRLIKLVSIQYLILEFLFLSTIMVIS